MRTPLTLSLAVAAVLGLSTAAVADSVPEVKAIQVVHRALDVVHFGAAAGTDITFTTGIGSGAYHRPGDGPDVVYTTSDRGVNIKCKDSLKTAGLTLCAKGKIFPVPTFSPSIYRLERTGGDDGRWAVAGVIQLKDADGNAISGLANPLQATNTESAFDISGAPMALDPEGVDTESLVRLADGTFWLGEEYGPSLVHVEATGEIIERLVPQGLAGDLAAANYPVSGTLPAILMKRKLNRGIESIAVSPDQQWLYFAVQSPLANPNTAAYKASRSVRVFKVERATQSVVGEYLYRIDLPTTFLADTTTKQSKVKVSEMVAIGTDRLILLERVTHTTKLYKVDLNGATNILGSVWDDTTTSPTLEQLADPASVGITVLAKTAVLDSAVELPGLLPDKVEGVALMDDETLFLINDNDFGIKGATTQAVDVELPKQRLR